MPRLLLLATAIMLTAGCVGAPDGDDGAGNNSSSDLGGMPAAVPAPIDESATVSGSADPLNLAGQTPCSSPSAQCQRYPFVLNGTATITATLTWTQPASDFDFYVYADGAPVITGASDVTAGPGTSETLEGDLEAGEYEIVIVPWSVAQDTFTLHAEFAPAAVTDEANETGTW